MILNSQAPLQQDNRPYRAFRLAARYASNPIDPNALVPAVAQRIGHTINVTIPGNPLDVELAAARGWQDPVDFMHAGHESWYVGDFPADLIGGRVGHVVDDPAGAQAHHDWFGPLDPFHWLIDWIPGMFDVFAPVSYTCSVNGGCLTADRSLMAGFDWWLWIFGSAALASSALLFREFSK